MWRPPGLARRFACTVYEGLILAALVLVACFPFLALTGDATAGWRRHLLQAYVLFVVGAYLVWFWTHGGQTLAMKTWQIRVVGRDGRPPSPARAALRYLGSWLWFLPALLWAGATGQHHGGAIAAALTVGVLGYAALTLLNPQRQYWHDLLAGTRLVRSRQPDKPR